MRAGPFVWSKIMREIGNSGLAGLVAALLLMASCSMRTVQEEPVDAGEAQSFDAPYADVVRAAIEGITRAKLDITRKTEEPDGFVILFVRPTSPINWGGAGRLVVDKSSAPPTMVHVTYDRRLPLSGSGQERYAHAIFAGMNHALGQAGAAQK